MNHWLQNTLAAERQACMELSEGTRPLSHRNLHRVGVVVASIQDAAPGFVDALHTEWLGKLFHDPNQAVRVTFPRSHHPGYPLVELVEPAGDKSPRHLLLEAGRRFAPLVLRGR